MIVVVAFAVAVTASACHVAATDLALTQFVDSEAAFFAFDLDSESFPESANKWFKLEFFFQVN